ncbi:MAG: hypothetical protein Devi2KO_39190 [Devosia indica]
MAFHYGHFYQLVTNIDPDITIWSSPSADLRHCDPRGKKMKPDARFGRRHIRIKARQHCRG